MKSIALSSATLDSFGVKADVLAFYSSTNEAAAQTLLFELESGIPTNITNYTFQFKMRKQTYKSASDSKAGYNIRNMEPDLTATEIDLTSNVTILDGPNGKAQVYIPPSLTTVAGTVEQPIIYSGFVEFQDNASSGELIQKLFVVVIVGS